MNLVGSVIYNFKLNILGQINNDSFGKSFWTLTVQI